MPIKTEELKEIALKQIELLNSDADVLKSSQQLSEKQIDELLSHVQQVQQKLSVLKFMLELPDGEEVVVTQNAVESNSEKEEKPAQHESIMHQVDDFEESIAEDAEEVKEDERSEPESETLSGEKPDEQKTEPVEEKKEEEIEEEQPKADSEDSAEKTEDRSEEKSEEVEEKSAEKGSDHEVEEKSTIEDSSPSNNSLADYLGSKRIDDLKTAIGLNERFLFSNELFDGNMEAFNRALSELNHLESYEHANNYVEKQLKPTYEWDMESETTVAFMSLIQRRFM
ncbi:hypothetical protein [Salibacter halophilus]|uniref:Uncharacterized protein n=1 Tax=Salibacter halophilus TaxID=1803916 RepID=A0A6N6M1T7_9FLAO|nr:hypothetical protein [Salibacter halophilus]KAB1062800.1 hypothetical protein F3059_11475 [Salibacter halophilus]